MKVRRLAGVICGAAALGGAACEANGGGSESSGGGTSGSPAGGTSNGGVGNGGASSNGGGSAGGAPSGGGGTLSAGGATSSGGSPPGGAGGAAGSGGATSSGGSSASAGGSVGDGGVPIEGFWPSGTDGLSRTFADAFGIWRGRPTTSNWINAHWQQWDWLTAPGFYGTLDGSNPVKIWDLYAGWKGVMVLSMSMAGSDSDPNYDQAMRDCATGAFDGYWETFAQNATDAGRTGANTVVSPAHEFNGTWFKWNPGTVGLDVWKSCWQHVYTAIHSKSSLRIVWVVSASSNTMKGGDFSVNTAWDAYPGDDYVDILGIDRYDFKSLSSATTTDWRDTCGNTQDICYIANYARQHGKPVGVPEWSMDRGQYGWGDLPSFVQMMYGFFRDNADILAFENNFNNGGTGDWNFYPESSINMSSAEAYKTLWKQ